MKKKPNFKALHNAYYLRGSSAKEDDEAVTGETGEEKVVVRSDSSKGVALDKGDGAERKREEEDVDSS